MFEKLNKSHIETLHDNQNFLYHNFADIFGNLLNSHAPFKAILLQRFKIHK